MKLLGSSAHSEYIAYIAYMSADAMSAMLYTLYTLSTLYTLYTWAQKRREPTSFWTFGIYKKISKIYKIYSNYIKNICFHLGSSPPCSPPPPPPPRLYIQGRARGCVWRRRWPRRSKNILKIMEKHISWLFWYLYAKRIFWISFHIYIYIYLIQTGIRGVSYAWRW